MIKTKVENHDKNQKIKGTFICGPLFSKWMGVFQSWLDCFSIGVWAFIQKIHFFFFFSLCILVSICQFLNVVIFSLIILFYKGIKLHPILSQFSTIILAQELAINIFGGDYSNLKNPVLSKDINIQYTRFIAENTDIIWCNKKEGLFWHYIFKKISYLGFFLISCQKNLLPPSVHFQ